MVSKPVVGRMAWVTQHPALLAAVGPMFPPPDHFFVPVARRQCNCETDANFYCSWPVVLPPYAPIDFSLMGESPAPSWPFERITLLETKIIVRPR